MMIIKRTRIKFVAVIAAVILIILSAFCTSILVSTHSRNINAANVFLEKMISDYNMPERSDFPNEFELRDERGQSERFNEMRGFTVRLNSDFEIEEIRYGGTIFTDGEIINYVSKIEKKGTQNGKIGSLNFIIKDMQNGKILAALDTEMENDMFNELLITVLIAGSGGMVILLTLAWFLSYWIIKPAADTFQKQKRFISEAGHEFKTPLTVISAGLDLLQKNPSESDSEKWIKGIKEQIEKMSVMTTELLTLSRIDETENIIKTEFDLSQTVLTEGLAFESVAFENGKTLLYEIENNLTYKGDVSAVRQAVAILCDNAIKYSGRNGTVIIKLKKQPSKISLSVSNTESKITRDEIPFIFERFYRGSEARAECNGAGLGLAILKTLADKHGWKISVNTEQDKTVFLINF